MFTIPTMDVCASETPEGPNIGLINSMAVAQVNKYGFIEIHVEKSW